MPGSHRARMQRQLGLCGHSTNMPQSSRGYLLPPGCQAQGEKPPLMDTLGFEPRAFRMRSGCDATTPCAPCRHTCSCMFIEHWRWSRCQSAVRCHVCSQRWYWPARWRCPTRMHGSGWCAHSAQRHDHCTQSLSCSIQLSDVAWLPQGPHAAAAGALWSLH